MLLSATGSGDQRWPTEREPSRLAALTNASGGWKNPRVRWRNRPLRPGTGRAPGPPLPVAPRQFAFVEALETMRLVLKHRPLAGGISETVNDYGTIERPARRRRTGDDEIHVAPMRVGRAAGIAPVDAVIRTQEQNHVSGRGAESEPRSPR